MKKFLLTIILAALAVLLPACSSEVEVSKKEQTIIEYALADLDEEGEATLELVSIKCPNVKSGIVNAFGKRKGN